MAWNVVIKNSHQEQSITVTVSTTSCHGILKYHCIIQASKHPNFWITQKHSSKCWGHSNMGTLTHNSLKKRTYDTCPTSSRARKQPLDRFSVHSPRPTPNITSHPHLDTANTSRNKSTSTDTRPPKHAQHQPMHPVRAVVSCPSYFAGVAGVAEVPKVVGGEHLAAGRYRNSATTLGPILGLVVNGKVGRRYVLAAVVLEEC